MKGGIDEDGNILNNTCEPQFDNLDYNRQEGSFQREYLHAPIFKYSTAKDTEELRVHKIAASLTDNGRISDKDMISVDGLYHVINLSNQCGHDERVGDDGEPSCLTGFHTTQWVLEDSFLYEHLVLDFKDAKGLGDERDKHLASILNGLPALRNFLLRHTQSQDKPSTRSWSFILAAVQDPEVKAELDYVGSVTSYNEVMMGNFVIGKDKSNPTRIFGATRAFARTKKESKRHIAHQQERGIHMAGSRFQPVNNQEEEQTPKKKSCISTCCMVRFIKKHPVFSGVLVAVTVIAAVTFVALARTGIINL